ncbi:hypothetical protein RND81_06G156800 [Saponaria officinalis]|uniref:Uncharacterized protein n=1 Tax=Saponaria officinalis TaxID=3572 RepID=A0AAW1K764_SAPOF
MCHPSSIGYSLPSLEEVSTTRGRVRRFEFRPPPLEVGPPLNQQKAVAEGGGEGRKVCLCSPTSHPGSFRCRYHHADYEWCRMKFSPRRNS